MARYVGIDIGATQVKVAVVRGSPRKWIVEDLRGIDRVSADLAYAQGAAAPVQTLDELIAEAATEPAANNDPLSVGFDGTQTYVRSLEVPAAVRRRLAEVLPFELEAQLPFDLDEAVFDHRPRPGVAANLPQPVIVAAAKVEEVRTRIELVKRTLGREPDHVAPSAFPLVDLLAALPALRGPTGTVRACLDLGYDQSELLIVDGSEPVFARTLSRGVQGLPHSAAALAREIRQTFVAWRSTGGVVPESVLVCGGGALVPDLGRWLSGELQLPVEPLPLAGIEGEGKRPDALRFARAIGIALAAAPKRRGLDLRRGPLAFERGYGFLREKVPLLAGLGATVLVAFLFATWTRARNLSADRATLEQTLEATTREVLGEATSNTERVQEMLGAKGPAGDDDPLPRADAMDVLVQVSELIPTDKIKHDIEKLDLQKVPSGGFRVSIQGIAPTGADVSTIEQNLKSYRCFVNPTVVKKTKAIADDRQKYTLETELRCPEEGSGPKKPAAGSPGAAGSK
ncbi:MAG: pilus assembly protein PilM [Deltaproteobacteria bacterium]|nr:pilus assembly protein PilM [Deltaproteobacteria bacterium]